MGGVWARSASGAFCSGALQEIIKITKQKKPKNKLSFVMVLNFIFNSLLLFFYYYALFIYSAHYKIINDKEIGFYFIFLA